MSSTNIVQDEISLAVKNGTDLMVESIFEVDTTQSTYDVELEEEGIYTIVLINFSSQNSKQVGIKIATKSIIPTL